MRLKKIDFLIFAIVIFVITYSAYVFFKNKKNTTNTVDNASKTTFRVYPDTLINVGKIKQNEVYDYRFTLKNTGSAILYIDDFTASCGCTSIEAESKKIAINDSTVIKGQIDTKGKMGNSISVIRFYSNTSPTINKLTIRYEVTK